MDVSVSTSSEKRSFLALPAEIRIAILEYVLSDLLTSITTTFKTSTCFKNAAFTPFKTSATGIILNENYTATTGLAALNTCKQFHSDGNILALNRITFVVTNLFFHVPDRLSLLHPKQVQAVRNLTFVADARHFYKLKTWKDCPFGVKQLRLDTLTIVLHRSSYWHYLYDFTATVVQLLRNLEGVKRFVFVRNNALVKGSFKTWYNRLVGLVLKIDHHERYVVVPPNPEKVWWKWNYDDRAQSFCMEACPAKVVCSDCKPKTVCEKVCEEECYIQQMLPLMEALRESCENEPWNPDPRSRNGF